MKSIYDYLNKEEVVDTQDVISLYTLEKAIKEKVVFLNKEFLDFKEFCNCEYLKKIINNEFCNEKLVLLIIYDICPFVGKKQISFSFDGSFIVNGFADDNLKMVSEGFQGNFEFMLIKDKNTDDFYFACDDNNRMFLETYIKYIKKYKKNIIDICDMLEKGYRYFGDSINENSLKIFKDGIYKNDSFEIKTDKYLNFIIDFKDADISIVDLFKRIPIPISSLDDNIQKILKANDNYRVEYDLFSDVKTLIEYLDGKNENISKIVDRYQDFERKYNSMAKDIKVSSDILKWHDDLKNKVYDINSNTYFGFMDIVDNNRKHFVSENDVCEISNDFDNLLCSMDLSKSMPYGNTSVDNDGCVSRVSGNMVVKNENGKPKIKVIRNK